MSAMHPDYLAGLRAWDRGEHLDPAWPSQKRSGWTRGQENTASRARTWCRDVIAGTVRASERAAAECLLNANDVDLAEVFRTPPDVLDVLGFHEVARYRKYAGRNPDWAQHRIAKALAEVLGTWVDPCDVHLFPARGYRSHMHQDCQRWTGHAEVEGETYTLGSWGITVSAIKMGERFELHDHRREARNYSDFSFERPEKKALTGPMA